MLVLSRKKHEKIIINDNITIMVIEIRGDKVRLGIEAPRGIEVHREEVWVSIKEEAEQQTTQLSEEEQVWEKWAENKGRDGAYGKPDECNRDATK